MFQEFRLNLKVALAAVLILIALIGFVKVESKSEHIHSHHNNGLVKSSNSNKQTEPLDDLGNILLTWEVFPQDENIVFEIEAETAGYIGFGISGTGGMTGADIFIAGVSDDGLPYHSDRFGIGNVEPVVDIKSDWKLLDAKELDEHGIMKTYLKFSRAINTCDDMDYPITNGTNRIIYALGRTDDLDYHSTNRGTRSLSLLGIPTPPIDLHRVESWEMTLEMPMPPESTAYWCSLHKGPPLTKKSHIVAFEAVLKSAEALRHTHHFSLMNCYLPPNSNKTLDEIFDNYTVDTGFKGDYCYKPIHDDLPFKYCMEFLYVWAKGGKRMVMPENIGYPIGDGPDPRAQSYYLLSIHYDNPNELKGLNFRTGVEFHYTEEPLATEAGLMLLGYDVDVTLLVPPNVKDFVVAGHCGPSCSAKFPKDGITFFNSLLHSHLSGRKLKLRHIRGDVELPWIDYDDHYDFDYQQNTPLAEHRKILPRDHLIYECLYDSTWKKGQIVTGGASTRDEMCNAFMWYYPKQEIDLCMSDYPKDLHFLELGITKYHNDNKTGKLIIDEPANLRGPYEESMSTKFVWTEEFKKAHLQRRRFGEQESFCKHRATGERWQYPMTVPINFKEFQMEQKCSMSAGSTRTLNISVYFILITLVFVFPVRS